MARLPLRVMTWNEFVSVLRGTGNAILDALGINTSVVETMKRTGKYNELGKLLNQINHAIEMNDIKMSDLKTIIQSESPLGIAYRKINNQINTMTKENTKLKDISRQAQYDMAKVDNSDVFNIGSNMKTLDNYATKVENYFKE